MVSVIRIYRTRTNVTGAVLEAADGTRFARFLGAGLNDEQAAAKVSELFGAPAVDLSDVNAVVDALAAAGVQVDRPNRRLLAHDPRMNRTEITLDLDWAVGYQTTNDTWLGLADAVGVNGRPTRCPRRGAIAQAAFEPALRSIGFTHNWTAQR